MNLRETLRKAAGLIIEMPEEAEPVKPAETPMNPAEPLLPKDIWAEFENEAKLRSQKTVEQIAVDTHGPNLDQIRFPANTAISTPAPDGTFDFQAIYAQANLPSAPFTAEQTVEMLAALPQELPLEAKRQTLRVMLGTLGKSLGATPETVVADASRKLAAIVAYNEHSNKQGAEKITQLESEIANLQAQTEAKRAEILDVQTNQTVVAQKCAVESHRLDDLLEFLSLDVPPSKYA